MDAMTYAEALSLVVPAMLVTGVTRDKPYGLLEVRSIDKKLASLLEARGFEELTNAAYESLLRDGEIVQINENDNKRIEAQVLSKFIGSD